MSDSLFEEYEEKRAKLRRLEEKLELKEDMEHWDPDEEDDDGFSAGRDEIERIQNQIEELKEEIAEIVENMDIPY